MSEMVERVARAIAESDGSCWDGIIGGRKITRDNYRSLARAAIEAMRVPTEGMLSAGASSLGDLDVEAFPCSETLRGASACWDDMINAALL